MDTNWRSTILWWVATVTTLVVLDDLVFGPAFWALARTSGAIVAVVAVFVVYIPAQMFLVYRGTTVQPGRIASWWLRRLDLGRRSLHIQQNVDTVRGAVTGGVMAIVVSPVIGGVLPPLLLWRRGWDQSSARVVAVPCAALYAATFSLIHAVVPAAL